MNLNLVILLALALVAANLPFFNERLFALLPFKSGVKNLGWRLLELVVLYFAVGAFAIFLEGRQGPIQHQKWEFYAVTACLFLVFAYPGYVLRYLWQRRGA